MEATFTLAPSHPVMKRMYVLPASATTIMVSFSPAAVVASSPSAPMFIIVDTAPVNFFPAATSTPARPTFHSCLSVAAAGAFCVWHHVGACYIEFGPSIKWRLMVPSLICNQYTCCAVRRTNYEVIYDSNVRLR